MTSFRDPHPDESDTEHHLVVSRDPAEVFASLAARCVPEVCDSCLIDLALDGAAPVRIEHPPLGVLPRLPDHAPATTDHVVCVRFAGPPVAEEPGPAFRGVVAFGWHTQAPTRGDRLTVAALVEAAVRTVAWQQSRELARAAAATADNLRIALITSRQIGAAIGILMSQHRITQEQAMDRLREASQASNRKLRDIASDVVETGCLDPS